jgi:hypothetical protein
MKTTIPLNLPDGWEGTIRTTSGHTWVATATHRTTDGLARVTITGRDAFHVRDQLMEAAHTIHAHGHT